MVHIFTLYSVTYTVGYSSGSGTQPFKICLQVQIWGCFSSFQQALHFNRFKCHSQMKWSSSLWYIPLDAGWIAIRIFLLFSGLNSKFLWAFDSKVVRLPDSSSKGTGSFYSRTLSNQRFILNCVLQVVHFVTLLSASCISLDSGQPTISNWFYAIKKCMLLTFFQQVLVTGCKLQHQVKVFSLLFFIQVDPMKSSSPNI